MRAILLYLSQARWARRVVTGWSIARRAAARFVAGDTLEEALDTVEEINQQGMVATLDHLGENVTNQEEAIQASDDYITLLERMVDRNLKSNASLKLTQLGLNVDFELCLDNMMCVARQAHSFGTYVRIDMEDSSTIDRTLQIYEVLQESELANVGLVFQSYLYRSEADVRQALERKARIRIVKGAYNEPPELAYPDKEEVDQNFDRLTKVIVDWARSHGSEPISEDGKVPPVTAVATHDHTRIEYAKAYAAEVGLPKSALEFQMLFGIRPELQTSLRDEGYPVRIYVPYGTEWYPYFMRRLAERPANVWFFLSNLFRR